MGVLGRFKDIMASNINALLDKCEDPAKMIDQTMRNLQEDLADVKKETASIMAEEKRCERIYNEKKAEVTKWEGYAKKALSSGNEDDARQFLAKKQQAEVVLQSAETAYLAAKANSDKMKQMHDKLVKDINELDARRDAIKAKVAVAKTQQKVNKLTSNVDSASSISAFERMEAKANKMLDTANAEAELNSNSGDPLDSLADKYDSTPDAAVEDELAKMKAEMGLM